MICMSYLLVTWFYHKGAQHFLCFNVCAIAPSGFCETNSHAAHRCPNWLWIVYCCLFSTSKSLGTQVRSPNCLQSLFMNWNAEFCRIRHIEAFHSVYVFDLYSLVEQDPWANQTHVYNQQESHDARQQKPNTATTKHLQTSDSTPPQHHKHTLSHTYCRATQYNKKDKEH